MKKKIVILALIALLVSVFFVFDLQNYFNLEYIKSHKESFTSYYNQNPLLTLGVFFGIYVAVTALSLPGAAVLTLTAGALFGVLTGAILVSFASTIGATLAFLVSRFLLQDFVQQKYKHRLKTINEGIKKEGSFYLFTLRLVPLFPFFVINLVMGLTPINTLKFFIVSQIGMLPGTILYVYAGTQLADIESAGDILSADIIRGCRR